MGPPCADLALCSLHQVARLNPTDGTLQVKTNQTANSSSVARLGRQGREPCARAPRQWTGQSIWPDAGSTVRRQMLLPFFQGEGLAWGDLQLVESGNGIINVQPARARVCPAPSDTSGV